jgi:hypothetical protein
LEYVTDAQVEKGKSIPAFIPFAWKNYEYGSTAI